MEQNQITISTEEYRYLLEKAARLKELEHSQNETDVIDQLKSSLEDLKHGRIKRLA